MSEVLVEYPAIDGMVKVLGGKRAIEEYVINKDSVGAGRHGRPDDGDDVLRAV